MTWSQATTEKIKLLLEQIIFVEIILKFLESNLFYQLSVDIKKHLSTSGILVLPVISFSTGIAKLYTQLHQVLEIYSGGFWRSYAYKDKP